MAAHQKQQRTERKAAAPRVAKGEKEAVLTGDLALKPLKKRPRGRPWPKGVSGNPSGRPKGAQNKLTEAVVEGIRRAKAEPAQPKVLNRERPYECWDGLCVQQGVWYGWDPLLQEYVALPDQEPPPPPSRFDPAGRHTEMMWKGLLICVQHGWPFDPKTWRRLKI